MSDNFADEFTKTILKMSYRPYHNYKDCPTSKTPCSKCIGVDSCFLQINRNPEEECKEFYPKENRK